MSTPTARGGGGRGSSNDFFFGSGEDHLSVGSLSVPPYSPETSTAVTPEPSSSRLTPSRLQLPPSPFFDTLSATGTNLSTPGDGSLPPVLLSPVLSRPVRSLSAQSSPFLLRNQVSDSEGELCNVWASVNSSGAALQRKRSSRVSRPSDSSSPLPTPPPYATSSPIGRSTSTSKIGSYHSSGGHLHSGNLTSLRPISPLLTRAYNNSGVMSDSGSKRLYDSFNSHPSTSRLGRMRRRPSTAASGDSSWLLGANTTSNLVRLRNSSLGRSDPQISASCQSRGSTFIGVSISPVTSAVKMRKSTETHRPASRRSLNVSTSPTLVAGSSSSVRCRSPVPPARACPPPTSSKPSHSGVALRGGSTKAGSSLAPFHHLDNRRWSLASLPSSSGYGTPGSNSAFSSQYSSQEHLCEMLGDMRLAGRYDSNDSCPSFDDAGVFRPRSRSLHSPMRLNSQTAAEVAVRSTIYKERFPKAKSHMEERLNNFIEEHAVLCGFSGVAADANTTVKPESTALRQQKSVDIPSESNLSAGVILRPRSSSGRCPEGSPRILEPLNAANRRSMIETVVDPTMVRLISDGATRFLLHQIVEIAADCLNKSKEDIITCGYFCEMSQRLEDTLSAAQDRTGPESFTYMSKLVKHLLMIVSRPARLLECLEFDPDEFYHLLEEAEGAVREKLGSGNARVPDLPQYIVGKLGLDRDPLMDIPPSDDENEEVEGGEKIEPEMQLPIEGAEMPKTRAPCEEDFDTIRLVSNGAYGAVYLVRHKETKQRFALKKMNKHTLILRNQVDQVYAERDILTFTDNPFVVSFYGSFETKHHLCMLMEYVEGGDCAALLKTCGTLPFDLVRLYMAETVLAIEYLHSYGIVHRDLKPDNLLITAMGHIKLTDFGLSKIGLMSRTTLVSEGCLDASSASNQQFRDKQLCGTPEYIAPEVILRQGYGNPVDWWALGIILYEFLVGIVPFLGDTPEELFSNIISEEVMYPTDEEALPIEAEHLIRILLEKNPLERLGTNFGAQELMTHNFFDALDFNSLLRQKAEFVPNLENDEDTSYFDTRTNRYNHEVDSGDDEVPMFLSFSTASPRHSIVGLDPAMQAHLQEIRAAKQESLLSKSPSEDHTVSPVQSDHDALSDHSGQHPSLRTPTPHRMKPDQLVPSAVLLRRRFSAQRQTNLSTSSSGTAGTPGGTEMGSGTGWIGTSTDSSIDASSFVLTESAGSAAISARRNIPSPMPPPRVPKISSSEDHQSTKELSPVEESMTLSQAPLIPTVKTHEVVLRGGASLHVTIPQASSSSPSSSSPHHANLQYYHAGPPVSPGGSISSVSSWDGTVVNTTTTASTESGTGSGSLTIGVPQARKPSLLIRKGPKGYGFTIKSVRVYLGEHSDYYTIEHIVTSVEEGSPAWEAGLRPQDLITHVQQQLVSNLNHPQLMHRLLSHGDTISLMVLPLATSTIKEGAARKSIGKLAKRKPKAPTRRNHLEKKSRKPSSLLRRLSGKRGGPGDIVPGTSSQKQTFMPRSVSSQDGAILGGSPGSSGACCSKSGVPCGSSGAPVSSLATTSKTASCYLDVDRCCDQFPAIPKQKRLSDVGIIGHRLHLSPASAHMPPVSPPPNESSSSRSLRKMSASRLMNRLRKND